MRTKFKIQHDCYGQNQGGVIIKVRMIVIVRVSVRYSFKIRVKMKIRINVRMSFKDQNQGDDHSKGQHFIMVRVWKSMGDRVSVK